MVQTEFGVFIIRMLEVKWLRLIFIGSRVVVIGAGVRSSQNAQEVKTKCLEYLLCPRGTPTEAI